LKWNVLKDKVVSKEGGIKEMGAKAYVACEYFLHDLMHGFNECICKVEN
jgi:hypothetical protein